MIRCILYPGAKLFVTSGGKEQASSIMKEKVTEICQLVPAFAREIDWRRGKTTEGKDYVHYEFKNGSVLDNLAARESSRGKRRHGGLMEECVGIDGKILNEVILPIMNVSRRAANGEKDDEEVLNKSQIYVNYLASLLSNQQQKPIELRGNLDQIIRSQALQRTQGRFNDYYVGSSGPKRWAPITQIG